MTELNMNLPERALEALGKTRSELARYKRAHRALLKFYKAVPVEVLRMQAGNGKLDMQAVDEAAAEVRDLLNKKG